MNKSTLLIHSAIASLIAVSSLTATQAVAAEGKEKCYGVAKKGQNDCGTANHSCHGNATAFFHEPREALPFGHFVGGKPLQILEQRSFKRIGIVTLIKNSAW